MISKERHRHRSTVGADESYSPVPGRTIATKRSALHVHDHDSSAVSLQRATDAAVDPSLLQIPEIWRFDGAKVAIEQLGPDGSYSPVDSSRFLPVTAKDILRWIVHEDSSDELEFERRVTEWARELRREK
jgi:hypothetical protein